MAIEFKISFWNSINTFAVDSLQIGTNIEKFCIELIELVKLIFFK